MTSESAAGLRTDSAVVTSSYFATKCRSSVVGLAGGAVGARGRARSGVLAGGAVSRGLRSSSGTIRVEQSSAAGSVRTGSRWRDGDGAIGSAIGRGDDVAGCGHACSLGGRCRRNGRGDSPTASRRVTKCSRAHRYDCVFGSGTTHNTRGAVISRGDAFTKRSRTSGRYGSGGSSRRTRGTVAITFSGGIRVHGTSDTW